MAPIVAQRPQANNAEVATWGQATGTGAPEAAADEYAASTRRCAASASGPPGCPVEPLFSASRNAFEAAAYGATGRTNSSGMLSCEIHSGISPSTGDVPSSVWTWSGPR